MEIMSSIKHSKNEWTQKGRKARSCNEWQLQCNDEIVINCNLHTYVHGTVYGCENCHMFCFWWQTDQKYKYQ